MGQTMRVVAIAKALERRGHEVKFLAGDKLIPIIRNFGIDVIEITDLPEFNFYSGDQPDDSQQQEKLLAQIPQVMARMAQIESEIADKVRPDLLLCGSISGAKVGRRLGIPTLLVFLQPHGQKTLEMFTQRLKDHKIRAELSSSVAAADLIVVEGMPEISGGVNFEILGANAADLQGKVHFTGPLLTEYPDELPDRDILKEKFIGAKDKKMVYITIGGGSPLIGERFLQQVLESLRILPEVTGVVATGIAVSPEKIKSLRPPSNAIIQGFVPGTEMIKASDVTVFHGGSSTLMTCLACGTPAVVIPSMGEQEDNGSVLVQSGAGIVLDKQTLTPQMLAQAIQTILNNPDYRKQATKLKVMGEKYGGAEVAASLAEKLAVREAVLR